MKVILIQDVPGLGDRGKTVNVADGYARNLLIPQKQALPATPAATKVAAELNRVAARKEGKVRAGAQERAKQLGKISLTIVANAGEEGRLFGSVTNADIADEIAGQDLGFAVDKRDIVLDEPIKALGRYTVKVKLFRDVHSSIEVWVVPPEGQGVAPADGGDAPVGDPSPGSDGGEGGE